MFTVREGHGGEIEDGFHAAPDQAVHHLLGRRARCRDDRDVARLLLEVGLEVLHVAHHQPVPARSDLAGILVIDRGNVKATLAESLILHERPTHLPGAHEHDAVGALQAEDALDLGGELGDGIAEAAFAEGAEEGEVFADLGRRGAAEARQFAGRDGGAPLRQRLFEEPEIEGETAHRAVGNLPHCELFHNC